MHLPAHRLSVALSWNGSNAEDLGFAESVFEDLVAEVLGNDPS